MKHDETFEQWPGTRHNPLCKAVFPEHLGYRLPAEVAVGSCLLRLNQGATVIRNPAQSVNIPYCTIIIIWHRKWHTKWNDHSWFFEQEMCINGLTNSFKRTGRTSPGTWAPAGPGTPQWPRDGSRTQSSQRLRVELVRGVQTDGRCLILQWTEHYRNSME